MDMEALSYAMADLASLLKKARCVERHDKRGTARVNAMTVLTTL